MIFHVIISDYAKPHGNNSHLFYIYPHAHSIPIIDKRKKTLYLTIVFFVSYYSIVSQ